MTITHKGIDYVFSVQTEEPRAAKPEIGWTRAKEGFWNLRCDYEGKWCQIAIRMDALQPKLFKNQADYRVFEVARIIDRFLAADPETDVEFWKSKVPEIAALLK